MYTYIYRKFAFMILKLTLVSSLTQLCDILLKLWFFFYLFFIFIFKITLIIVYFNIFNTYVWCVQYVTPNWSYICSFCNYHKLLNLTFFLSQISFQSKNYECDKMRFYYEPNVNSIHMTDQPLRCDNIYDRIAKYYDFIILVYSYQKICNLC